MNSGIWNELKTHNAARSGRNILDLFKDPDRASVFSCAADGMLFDFSKTQIDDGALSLLLELARRAKVEDRRAAMFAGEKINETEGRAVLHTALRAPTGPIHVDGQDVMGGVLETRARMEAFATAVRSGEFAGAGGAYTDVVNIGIGGSDLGPAMATIGIGALP